MAPGEPPRYDTLTGLPDRAMFATRVEELLRTSPPDALLGLCIVDFAGGTGDVDPAGDGFLLAVARRLCRAVTGPGTLLARLSGTEFVLLVSGPRLLPGATVDVARQVGQLLAAPLPVGGQERTVAASIAVVERQVAETTHTDLLACAAHLKLRQTKAGDRARWMVVDLDRARATVRMR